MHGEIPDEWGGTGDDVQCRRVVTIILLIIVIFEILRQVDWGLSSPTKEKK